MARRQPQAIVNEHPCPPSSAHATPSLAPSHPFYLAVQLPTLREEAHAAGLEINPLKDQPFGAKIVGLDLMHNPITSELVSVVRKALLTHQVSIIPFRPQFPGDKPTWVGWPSYMIIGPIRETFTQVRAF